MRLRVLYINIPQIINKDQSISAQVSEAYSLHRETFYLAQDFFDRFMLTQSDLPKNQLQLIGITALFIAAKMEVGTALFNCVP